MPGATQGRARLVWTALDAAVSGCGIWATNFIAMLAYDFVIGDRSTTSAPATLR
jgi:NO-binding membrane sensor protein with MHYT domain